MMVPALAEQHAAHKARLARMGAAPTRTIVIVPAKVEEVEPAAEVVEIKVEEPAIVIPSAFNGMKRQARELIATIAEAHGVTFRDVIGSTRFKEVVAARMESCFQIAKQIPDMSLSQIGQIIRKDHTTVINAVRVLNERYGENVRNLGFVTAERIARNRIAARISAGVEVRS